MADTTRTRAALQALLADNNVGDISPQDLRDMLVSLTMQDSSENVLVPKTAGVGMKLDPATPVFGWKDLLGEITVQSIGPTSPTWATYRGTISQYQMDSGDFVWNAFHLPHDFVVGSDIFIHTHWSQNVGNLDASPGNLIWSFDISYAHGYERGEFSAPITVTVDTTPEASSPQYSHIISEVKFGDSAATGGILDTDDMEVDGIVLVRTNWTTNNLSPSADPFLHYIDVHYQSTNMPTIDKNYPFYT